VFKKKRKYGFDYGSVFPFFLSLLILFLIAPPSINKLYAQEPDRVDDLIRTAKDKHLHEARYWHILLHYQHTIFGIESQIDDPAFFLAPDGKTNPEAELEETITLLFQPDTEAAKQYTCRYSARFAWLKSELGVAPDLYNDRICREIEELPIESASLIFPTYYMNNPASMFGHTLLIVNTDFTNKRLYSAVNYAARTENTNGINFAIRGLLGSFKGYYSVMPYYKKIQEYSDINQRDIWEYKLNLKPDEIRRMVRHVKELEEIYTDYYFFDENCSYNLLYMLETARPSVHLTDQFGSFVLPIDTVKKIDAEGLITGVDFRPAKSTIIKHQLSGLSNDNIQTVLSITKRQIKAEDVVNSLLSREEKIRILDLAINKIRYLYVKEEITKEEYRSLILDTLSSRSKLGKAEHDTDDIPVPPHPDQGHDSRRISLGFGIYDGDMFQEIAFRPAFTDLLDMDYIHDKGAQIEFFNGQLRFYPSAKKLYLQKLNIVDILSITPRNELFKPFSWKINTGFKRKQIGVDDNTLLYHINTGGGVSVEDEDLGLCYAMLEPELNIGGALEDNYAMGGGLSFGVLKQIGTFWRIHLFGRNIWFIMGDDHQSGSLEFLNNFKISRNNHLSIELKREKNWENYTSQGVVYWHYFF